MVVLKRSAKTPTLGVTPGYLRATEWFMIGWLAAECRNGSAGAGTCCDWLVMGEQRRIKHIKV